MWQYQHTRHSSIFKKKIFLNNSFTGDKEHIDHGGLNNLLLKIANQTHCLPERKKLLSYPQALHLGQESFLCTWTLPSFLCTSRQAGYISLLHLQHRVIDLCCQQSKTRFVLDSIIFLFLHSECCISLSLCHLQVLQADATPHLKFFH